LGNKKAPRKRGALVFASFLKLPVSSFQNINFFKVNNIVSTDANKIVIINQDHHAVGFFPETSWFDALLMWQVDVIVVTEVAWFLIYSFITLFHQNQIALVTLSSVIPSTTTADFSLNYSNNCR